MVFKSDAQLLREYAEERNEQAFTEIVSRHTDLVFSCALRQVDSPDLARDVAQNVFASLARGADSLSRRLEPNSSLAGWLNRCTRNVTLNLRRDEFRRLWREKQAMEDFLQNQEAGAQWEQLRPLLDEAMAALNDADHESLVLRYFENHDLRTVGRAMDLSDDAAQKRVSRALEKLREILVSRGLTTTASALSVVISANAVKAAPPGLVATLSTGALGGIAVSNSANIVATKTIAMTMMQKTLISAALTAALAFGIYETSRASHLRSQVKETQAQQLRFEQQNAALARERDGIAQQLAALREDHETLARNSSELLRLRGEITRLKSADKSASKGDITEAAMISWLNRVKEFKRLPARMPDKAIPELRLLTEEDWLELAKRPLDHNPSEVDLEDEQVARMVFNAVRSKAKDKLMRVFSRALEGYAAANKGELPGDPSQLQPFLMNSHFLGPARVVAIPESAVDETVFLRYEILRSGKLEEVPEDATILAEKAPVDSEYDTCLRVGRFWMGVSGMDAYSPAKRAKHE